MAIYLKIEKPNSVEELLLKLFLSELNSTYNTGSNTYTDIECTQIQCEAGKWRSFDDIYEIVNTYFPNTDEKTVIHEILVLPMKTTKGKELFPYFNYCNKINMCTMMFYYTYHACETTFSTKTGEGKYAWGTLFELLGITNAEQLKDYILNKPKTIKNEETITETV